MRRALVRTMLFVDTLRNRCSGEESQLPQPVFDTVDSPNDAIMLSSYDSREREPPRQAANRLCHRPSITVRAI